jgi:phosphate transport system substrate-binding protein
MISNYSLNIQNINSTIMKIKVFKLFALAAVVLLAGCGGGEKAEGSAEESARLEGEIRIDGSSTVYPITEAVAEEFRVEQPRVKVTIGVSGTGGGFKKFCRAETDISDASRPIKDKEKVICSEAGIEWLELPVAYDGMAVLANPENDWLESITVEELKKIWEPAAQESVTKWNQVNPDWPDKEIRLFGPGVASGTFDYFTEAIVGESGSSRGDYTASEDDNVLVQGIAGDKYALGFFGLAYYEENKDKLRLVAVDGGNGPVLPSAETVEDGTYAPLSRPIFIYVSSTAAERPEVVEFVHFYLATAGELVSDVGYISLPADMYSAKAEAFAAFVE